MTIYYLDKEGKEDLIQDVLFLEKQQDGTFKGVQKFPKADVEFTIRPDEIIKITY